MSYQGPDFRSRTEDMYPEFNKHLGCGIGVGSLLIVVFLLIWFRPNPRFILDCLDPDCRWILCYFLAFCLGSCITLLIGSVVSRIVRNWKP